MLHETNRTEVAGHVVEWLERHTSDYSAYHSTAHAETADSI
ncbi:hypothetical protein [Paenibacillus marchantiae]